jgi:RNA polymerase sigma-70 factor (ECF subfamily)
VLKYQDRIYRLIQRLVSGSDVVDDLAQEVFIRAYRSLGEFKGESSLYTWLYKIALNRCN